MTLRQSIDTLARAARAMERPVAAVRRMARALPAGVSGLTAGYASVRGGTNAIGDFGTMGVRLRRMAGMGSNVRYDMAVGALDFDVMKREDGESFRMSAQTERGGGRLDGYRNTSDGAEGIPLAARYAVMHDAAGRIRGMSGFGMQERIGHRVGARLLADRTSLASIAAYFYGYNGARGAGMPVRNVINIDGIAPRSGDAYNVRRTAGMYAIWDRGLYEGAGTILSHRRTTVMGETDGRDVGGLHTAYTYDAPMGVEDNNLHKSFGGSSDIWMNAGSITAGLNSIQGSYRSSLNKYEANNALNRAAYHSMNRANRMSAHNSPFLLSGGVFAMPSVVKRSMPSLNMALESSPLSLDDGLALRDTSSHNGRYSLNMDTDDGMNNTGQAFISAFDDDGIEARLAARIAQAVRMSASGVYNLKPV